MTVTPTITLTLNYHPCEKCGAADSVKVGAMRIVNGRCEVADVTCGQCGHELKLVMALEKKS